MQYGPDIATEAELRLLGNVADKRVLDLGCGGGQNLVALATQGAHAIGLDVSSEQLSATKRLSEREGRKVDVHQGDLADLAFLRADSVDVALSVYGLCLVEDLSRLFRQVHRVLRQGAALVLSLPHPAYHLIDEAAPDGSLGLRRSYFDRSPTADGQHHTMADLFSALSRANFRLDTLLEPEPAESKPRSEWWRTACLFVPHTLVVRARKMGI